MVVMARATSFFMLIEMYSLQYHEVSSLFSQNDDLWVLRMFYVNKMALLPCLILNTLLNKTEGMPWLESQGGQSGLILSGTL